MLWKRLAKRTKPFDGVIPSGRLCENAEVSVAGAAEPVS